jgi:hypothetical protein
VFVQFACAVQLFWGAINFIVSINFCSGCSLQVRHKSLQHAALSGLFISIQQPVNFCFSM